MRPFSARPRAAFLPLRPAAGTSRGFADRCLARRAWSRFASRADRGPVLEAGGVMPAHAGVLEHAPAFLAVEPGPGQMISNAERYPAGHGRVGQVVDGGTAPPPAHPPAMQPVP